MSRGALRAIVVLATAVALSAPARAASDGQTIFQQQCAGCHGSEGQGTDYHDRALVGDLAISQLAEVIARTMPEGEPDRCSGEDARAVAAYLHDAFYSPVAQARRRPLRIELSRLTARQYQQTLSDLAQSFTWRGKTTGRPGLKFQLFQGPWQNKKWRKHEAVVSQVQFDLLASGLVDHAYLFPKEEDEPKDVMQRARNKSVVLDWRGGVRADETGEYEFVVYTNAGFKLWLNGGPPLIDRGVQSGEASGGSATIRLVEGRVYPISLEAKRVYEDKLTVTLAWRPPSGVEQPIPSHALLPHDFPAKLALDTPLPPDDRSAGFERGANVSASWDEATTRAALEASERLVVQLPDLLKLPNDSPQARSKVQTFCLEFADRAFRHPMNEDEQLRFVEQWFNQDIPWQEAARLSLVATLKSPRFLYPEIGWADAPRDWRAAGRLALAMWDSIPDKDLELSARREKLSDRQEVARQAEWMLQDPRTTSKLMAFLREWLDMQLDEPPRRDPEVFAGFDEQVAADMRTSLDLFLADLLASDQADFRQLFLSDEMFLNDRLAHFLGAPDPGGKEFHRTSFESEFRSGFITHPYVVTTHAYYRETSPIHRGVFLARHVLGRTLPPPPEAVAPTPPDSQPDLTTRERVTLQTSPNACQQCHVLINNLGFSLEQFDAAGRFRSEELGEPVDTTGKYISLRGEQITFSHARELAEYLARSEDVQRAFVIQLFEYASKQPALAYGAETVDRLVASFAQHDYNIKKLFAEIAVTIAIHGN